MAVERLGGVFISSIVFFVMSTLEKLVSLCVALNADANICLPEARKIRRQMTIEEAQEIYQTI